MKEKYRKLERDFDKEYKLFLNAWGEEAQMRIAVEEMSELTKEIMKYIRFTKDVKADDEKVEEIKKNLVSEIADVLNCVDNLSMMFGRSEVEKIRIQKVERTFNKLKEEDKKVERTFNKLKEEDKKG